MKKIRIFAFPSHSPRTQVSGVDWARIIQPMEHLNGYSDGETTFEVDMWDGKKIEPNKWYLKVGRYDIVYLGYLVNDLVFATLGCMARLRGVKMVMDIDDALWLINPDNTVYETYKKGSKGIDVITSIANEVDYVTCTNSYLRNVIANYTLKKHEKIAVFPNCIDLDFYSYRADLQDKKNLRITHFGSSSHYADLTNPEFVTGMDRIMQEYPNVTFLTIGSFFPEFREKWGQRYEEGPGHPNLKVWVKERFPEVMAKTDIFVAPLTENVYNRAKSDIKRSEVGTAKVPFIGQRIRQYEEVITDGVDGFLARTADEWYSSIKKLLDDFNLRKKIGEAGFERVKRERQIKDLVPEYAKFFKIVAGKKD